LCAPEFNFEASTYVHLFIDTHLKAAAMVRKFVTIDFSDFEIRKEEIAGQIFEAAPVSTRKSCKLCSTN
jgi:hypothetical protein